MYPMLMAGFLCTQSSRCFPRCTVYLFLRGSLPPSFPAKPRSQSLRCRVCRPFQASIFCCYRCYRYSPCGLPSSVSVSLIVVVLPPLLFHPLLFCGFLSRQFYLFGCLLSALRCFHSSAISPHRQISASASLPPPSRHLLFSLLSLSLLLLSGIMDLGLCCYLGLTGVRP